MMALLIKGLLSAVLVIVKILCCLLGLLLLVILLVIFIPLRYQGRLSKEREKSLKEISLAGDIRWLCGVLRVSAAYNGREGAFSLYVMGIPADKLFKRKNRRHAGRPGKRSRMKETGQTAPESRKTERHAGEDEKDKKDKKDKKYKKYSGSRGRTSARTGRVKSGHGSASKRPAGHPPRRKNIRAGRTGVNKKKLRLLLSRDFWQNGGCLFVKHLLRLARKLLPRKISGELSFSLEDVGQVGEITALLAMLLPLHKNQIAFYPDFGGEDYIAGKIEFKGHICIGSLLWFALRIYRNRAIRNFLRS